MGTHWFTHSQWGFNPRAREGRDILTLHKMADLKDVSIHAPARGATRELCGLGVFAREFQSTRPRGARPVSSSSSSICSSFQSTRPRGARHACGIIAPHHAKFQSTRPRWARHHRLLFGGRDIAVSIHAPARGATIDRHVAEAARERVSIHAPARGATRFEGAIGRRQKFQSTRPRGARPGVIWPRYRCLMFQSTRPRGARPLQSWNKLAEFMFQSTRPRGARQWKTS